MIYNKNTTEKSQKSPIYFILKIATINDVITIDYNKYIYLGRKIYNILQATIQQKNRRGQILFLFLRIIFFFIFISL